MMHASICRMDTAAVQAEDIAYVLASLQTRTYDPVGNLRKADDPVYGPAGQPVVADVSSVPGRSLTDRTLPPRRSRRVATRALHVAVLAWWALVLLAGAG